jgi:uncharacterized YceG family protein
VAGGDGPFDLLAGDRDVTISRPPDVGGDRVVRAARVTPVPPDLPEAAWQPGGSGGRTDGAPGQGAAGRARGAPAVRAPRPASQAAPGGYVGSPGDQTAPAGRRGRAQIVPPSKAAPAGDRAAPAGDQDPGYGVSPGHQVAGPDDPDSGYVAPPGSWHAPADGRDPGYGALPDDEWLAGSAGAGSADGAGGGRRGLAGRLPGLPAGRPSLPVGLGGLGGRLAGLRAPRSKPDADSKGGRGTGGARRGAVPARRTAVAGGASRVGSLRGSRDARTPVRRPVSDSRSTKRTTGGGRSTRRRIAAIVALVGAVVAVWFLFSLFQPLKGDGHGTVDVVIPSGASTGDIGSLLAKDHVISSAFFFKLRAELSGKRGKLESGRYVLREGMSYGAALTALTGTSGQPPVTLKVTIPEGFSRIQISALAKKAGVVGNYVAASVHSHVLKPTSYGARSSVHSLEGFLFPDTYDLLPGAPVSTLINDQLAAFKQNFAKLDLSAAKRADLTPYDVVTIASMVEREAEVPRERPLIAAVIYNRLRANMPLGIDATLRYALNDYDQPLTDSQLALNSPYNTRLHRGLPPTPIGNPGLASLEAAAHPADVPYLYYVVKPGTCGEDAFSTTFAQFEHDSALYNEARNADHGRSPTTCSG